jgi:hypothetical protein
MPTRIVHGYPPKRGPKKRKPQRAIATSVVTIWAKPSRFGDAPDLKPEEHRRRGTTGGGLAGRTELWTGSDVASSRPVRRIVLRG